MSVLDPETLAAILAPIPGESPAGQDLRYDPRYDVVRDARREDDDLPEGGLATERKFADWPRVQKDAIALLSTGSKDLTLASWLAEALLKRAGLGGLTSGLAVVQGLVDQFWETLYPELEDGDEELRLGPLDWIGSRLALPVRQVAVAGDGLSFLAYRDSLTVPSETEAEENRDKRALRAEKLAEGKLAPEVTAAAIAATPKAFYKTLVAGVAEATRALDALETATAARFEDEPPNFRALRAALDDVQRFAAATLADKLQADPDPILEDPIADGGSNAPAATATAVGGPIAPEPVDRNDAAARVAVAARFLRQQDPTVPTAYLLLRGLRWGEVRSPTGQVDPKLLEAPAPAARTRLKTLLLDGKWPELLEQGEQIMATPAGRGWLDLQRYVITACARLGPGYQAVELAIRAELAALLASVPQLAEMTLMDDMPTANGETLDWLADEGLDGERGPAANGAAPEDGADSALPDGTEVFAIALDGEGEGDLLAARGSAARHGAPGRRRTDRHAGAGRNGEGAEDPYQLAKGELARGRTNRAVELLVAELDRERSARGRFVRQTQLAQIMVEAGLAQVAQPILRQLVETIDEKSLESWEAGPLVAQPMVLMCRVIDALELDSAERETLYLRVCRLDPLQAIGLRRPS